MCSLHKTTIMKQMRSLGTFHSSCKQYLHGLLQHHPLMLVHVERGGMKLHVAENPNKTKSSFMIF